MDNNLVFNDKDVYQEQRLSCIQICVYLWLKSKIRGLAFSIHDWEIEPWMCINAITKDRETRKTVKRALRR